MKKNILCLGLALMFFTCKPTTTTKVQPYLKISGKTMGTTYNITYQGGQVDQVKKAVQQKLQAVNKGASTYDPESVISYFNKAKDSLDLQLMRKSHSEESIEHFIANLMASQKVYADTDGYFDATVMPLVNYWGFGYTGRKAVAEMDKAEIEALLQLVGLDKVGMDGEVLWKTHTGIQLDFSAIAKGYGVDEVAKVVEGFGAENYFVEIGGEAVTKGLNPRGQKWTLGINVPDTEAALTAIFQKVAFSDRGMATSGDYRNFFEVDGRKYGHSISPKTGKPESTLLSVSVIAPNCMMADAYATAFMVMGLEKAMAISNAKPEIEAFFIFEQDTTMKKAYTKGFEAYLVD